MSALKMSRLALQALVLAFLGACAGGGGGGVPVAVSPPPPPPPPSGPPVFPPLLPPHADGDFPAPASAEFTNNWAVAGTNAQIAWQNNATGAGVLIGVIDDGIDPGHPELAGRVSPNSIDIVPTRDQLVTHQSHGSELASLMVGNYNGAQTVGVAFDATVLAIRSDNGAGGFGAIDLANAIDYARQQGVDVINLSIGASGPIGTAVEQAIRRATEAGVIIVVSAGNSGHLGAITPDYPGFYASNPTLANGLIMIAGGLNPDGSVNPISNPAGAVSRDFYLVAPGWQIIVPDFGPVGPVPGYQSCGTPAAPAANLCRIQGTSYSSPMVAAAVALVMDGFPGLTPDQVVDLLYTTADDVGAPGIDNITGRGRLNIGRAFQAVGPLSAPLGGSEVLPTTQLGAIGPAFGDGFSSSSAWTMAGFDSFGRTFPVNLAGNWLSAAPGPSASASAPLLWRSERDDTGVRVQAAFAESVAPDTLRTPVDRAELEQTAMRIDAALAPGFTASFAAHGARAEDRIGGAISHLDMVGADQSMRLTRSLGDGLSVSLLSERGHAPSALAFTAGSERVATAARASFGGEALGFDLTMGRVSEERGVLGLVWGNEFGQTPSGETRFAGASVHFNAGPAWRISASGEFGVAELAQTGWLNVVEPFRTTAFSLQAQTNVTPIWFAPFGVEGQGVLTLSLAQPLRVEDGSVSFMAPTANEYGRQSLSYEQRVFSPTPSGRELRLGMGYSYFAGETFSAFGEAIYVVQPGHVSEADADTVVRFGFRVAH